MTDIEKAMKDELFANMVAFCNRVLKGGERVSGEETTVLPQILDSVFNALAD